MPQPQLYPFRFGTRRRIARVQNITATGFETAAQPLTTIQLDKTGYLCAIWLLVDMTFDVVAQPITLGVDGIEGFWQTINVNANLGSAAIVNASGVGVAVASRGMSAMGPRGQVSALTVGTGRRMRYLLRVPIAANDTDQMTLGAINLQDPQIQVNVALTIAALTSVFVPGGGGSLANANARITIAQEYWDIPDPRQFAMPPRSLVRTLEDANPTPIITGENIYQMPRLGTLLQYHQIVYLNSLRADLLTVLDSVQLRLNKTVYVETIPPLMLAGYDSYFYGALVGGGVLGNANVPSDVPLFLEPGVITRDYWHSAGIMNAGDSRDFIDTEEITTTEYLTNLLSGVSGTSNIRHVRRVAQML